jgi:hypothetical protein
VIVSSGHESCGLRRLTGSFVEKSTSLPDQFNRQSSGSDDRRNDASLHTLPGFGGTVPSSAGPVEVSGMIARADRACSMQVSVAHARFVV